MRAFDAKRVALGYGRRGRPFFGVPAAAQHRRRTSSTPAVNTALAGATAFFAVYTPGSTLSDAVRAQAIAYAGTLADYNEGDIGPGHCLGESFYPPSTQASVDAALRGPVRFLLGVLPGALKL